jgi:hypothetical protein
MQDIFDDHVDPARDYPKDREIKVPNGASFLLKQSDPHGFWRVHRERGQIPEHLKGEYTNLKMATEAVEAYVARPVPASIPEVKKEAKA